MKENLLIVDFETVGYDDGKAAMNPMLAEPIQLAAVMMNGRTLAIDYKNTFMSDIKPGQLTQSFKDKNWDGTESIHPDITKWHCNIKGISEDLFKKRLNEAPPLSVVWNNFLNYIETIRTSKTDWGLPILAGHNIVRYDCIILNRIQSALGPKDKSIFQPRDILDTMPYLFSWLENKDIKSLSLDNLRKYFGITTDNAHDALKDCLDCAKIIKRFLKWQRNIAFKTEFKGSFTDWKDDE